MAKPSFLDNLSWLRCQICDTQFHRDKKFMLLQCDDVVCFVCATKMRSTTEPNRVFCEFCKKTVAVCLIRETMSKNLRVLFMDPSKLAMNGVRVHNIQQRLHTTTNEKLREECKRLEKHCNHMLRVRDNYDNRLANDLTKRDSMRNELLKVMSEERLQYLLSLGGDSELAHMTASQLIGGANNGSRQQSVDTGPVLSSTPYWGHPRQCSSTPYSNDARPNEPKHTPYQSTRSFNSTQSRIPQPFDFYRRNSREQRWSDDSNEAHHRRLSREKRNSRERRPSGGYRNSDHQ